MDSCLAVSERMNVKFEALSPGVLSSSMFSSCSNRFPPRTISYIMFPVACLCKNIAAGNFNSVMSSRSLFGALLNMAVKFESNLQIEQSD